MSVITIEGVKMTRAGINEIFHHVPDEETAILLGGTFPAAVCDDCRATISSDAIKERLKGTPLERDPKVNEVLNKGVTLKRPGFSLTL